MQSIIQTLKNLIIGRSRSPKDTTIFHKISLIAFFAWIGLGADGLSSSCYGPQEAFLTLANHPYLSIFVAVGTVLTIFIISASYSQIVELFPTGGGGYLVASKLLSPAAGMLSGCALLIDYVLTITVSIASGADAISSLLPLKWHSYRVGFAVAVVLIMTVLNMRGVKESVLTLVPIFLIFLITHVFIIFYAVFTNISHLPGLISSTSTDVHNTVSEVGLLGMAVLILRGYSMGAGTFTGIEAVSNGIPVLREPRVKTAKRTMIYMAASLSFTVLGLFIAYLLYGIKPEAGKTLNAILFEDVTGSWGKSPSIIFVMVALLSEATLLFVAAQTGFIGGPGVLANMSLDRWFPTKFSALSDRLVIQNGILIMGGLSLILMTLTRGSVRFLVVLYSINVFITFVLSQLGMVRHWWLSRREVKPWRRKLLINGIGLILTAFILVSMISFKFNEGGWITLLITGALVALAILIKRHYKKTMVLLRRLDELAANAQLTNPARQADQATAGFAQTSAAQKFTAKPQFDTTAKTAVLLVSGFNGMGLHTLFAIIRLFGSTFKNFVFIQIGVIDVGNFKGTPEVKHLQDHIKNEIDRYVEFMNREGYYAEGISEIGVDIIEEIERIVPRVTQRFPNAVFFGGQLVFPKDSFVLRLLHNHIVFALQKRLYLMSIPFVILPIRVY
ncbi:MAG: APC family permease [Sedimentisphaerales bacterium]|nr:APC family permease [Sedimentisphaerales bacterium]